jgi:hypothetical protein
VHRWDYKELVLVVDVKTGIRRWQDRPGQMTYWPTRINSEADQGWELLSAYSLLVRDKNEVHFLLRRGTLL